MRHNIHDGCITQMRAHSGRYTQSQTYIWANSHSDGGIHTNAGTHTYSLKLTHTNICTHGYWRARMDKSIDGSINK